MAVVFTQTLKELAMKVSGKKINKMEKALRLGLRELCTKEII
jgi:hypothetical protein